MIHLQDDNTWFNHLRLGLLETTKFIYGDRVNIKYSKEFALKMALYLNKRAEQYMK